MICFDNSLSDIMNKVKEDTKSFDFVDLSELDLTVCLIRMDT